VFGTIGIAMYLGDLAEKVFKDSLLFPFALSLIGITIIAFGLYYHRHQAAITTWIDAQMPDALKRLRPANNVA
jgi:ABC-type molybdate transport system permease subunit